MVPRQSGTVMAGGAIAEVVQSGTVDFKPGDLVFADTGWQEYSAVPAKTAQKLEPRDPLSYLLSVYGIAGLTAYFGLLKIGDPKPGETVAVSAAAGSVGSIGANASHRRPRAGAASGDEPEERRGSHGGDHDHDERGPSPHGDGAHGHVARRGRRRGADGRSSRRCDAASDALDRRRRVPASDALHGC